MRLNFNEQATVKLTEFGARVYNDYMAQFPQYLWERLMPGDALRIELWNLSRIFGPHCYNGAPAVPFQDNVLDFSPS